ncbi:MAG: hypothetical protein ACHQ51_06425 [Elusimicrobiota bacterium]
MIASLLAALLLVTPARAATVRVDAESAVVPRVAPLSSPLSAPAPSLTAVPGLSAAPCAFFAPDSRVAPALSAAPLGAALPEPAPLPAAVIPAAPALDAAPAASLPQAKDSPTPSAGEAAAAPSADDAASPGFAGRIRGLLRRLADPFASRNALAAEKADGIELHPLLAGKSADLRLDGLTYKGTTLMRSGQKAEFVGRGMRGVVAAHPEIPGAVVKTVSMVGSANPMIAETELSPTALFQKEAKTARALEAAGVGPRYFGDGVVDGRLSSVRERVYGNTLEKLFSARAYGPKEHALVLVMLRKMADAGISASDMKPANIMIGSTAADPERRAYLVDGGAVSALPADLPAEKRVESLLESYLPTNNPYGLGTTLGKVLQKGLGRYQAPKAAPVVSEAERLDKEFAARDVWSQVAPAIRAEIEGLRAEGKSKAEVTAYVRAEADAATARILAGRGMTNLGFHYNLHGGARDGYVGRGISATMGDIALNYTIHGDRNYKVYFFQTEKYRLYDILNESNPAQYLFPSRMGNNLSVFDLNAPVLTAARADGRIKNFGQISMDFHGMKGVPYSTYLAPPIEVFHRTAQKIGMKKLSRDEETLATVRYLEAALIGGGPFIPKN